MFLLVPLNTLITYFLFNRLQNSYKNLVAGKDKYSCVWSEAMCKETERHDIVPVCEPEEEKINSERIEIYAGELKISLPDNFNEQTLQRLLGVLK